MLRFFNNNLSKPGNLMTTKYVHNLNRRFLVSKLDHQQNHIFNNFFNKRQNIKLTKTFIRNFQQKRSSLQIYNMLNALSYLIFGIAFGFLTIPLYRLFCQV